MYKALHLSPMIPSYDIKKTAAFFTDLFEFGTAMLEEDYAILYKNNFTIHILKASSDIGEMEFYLEVDYIDILWGSIKDKLGDIKVKAPFNQAYGMREFHVVIPHTRALMFVGQAIKQNAAIHPTFE